jgi:hypothetical protein
MKFYSGYYFCTRSCWDNGNYDCKNLVAIENYSLEYSEYGNEDFKKLIKSKLIFDEERFSFHKEHNPDNAESFRTLCNKKCYFLDFIVEQWLLENVLDDQKGVKGWCVGNDEYNSNDSQGFSLFFYRRRDALKFIRQFSVYQKPTETYNQNSYIHKILDLKTMTMVLRTNKIQK